MNKLIKSSALLFFLLSACSSSPAIAPTLTSDRLLGIGTSVPTATEVTLIADLMPSQTYMEKYVGFAFDYPQSWTINALPDVPGSTVTIHSWDPATLSGPRPQGEGLPAGGEKMDIFPLTDFNVDYAHALPWFREQNADNKFTEEQVILPSGAPGVLIRFNPVEGEPQARCLLTEVNHTAMMLCGAAWEFHFFEAIAFSIRATH